MYYTESPSGNISTTITMPVYNNGPKLTTEKIYRVAAELFGVSVGQLMSSTSRKDPLPSARFVVMWFCFHKLHMNKLRIGKMMNLDHTTVINGLKQVAGMIDVYPAFRKMVADGEAMLYK